MKTDFFYKNIVETLARRHIETLDTPHQLKYHIFLKCLDDVYKNKNLTSVLKITRLSILFEGFYRSISNPSVLRDLVKVRIERWSHHYGVPTILFLLTYNSHIEETCQIFTQMQSERILQTKPWEIKKKSKATIDCQNEVLVDENAILVVAMPSEDEKTGQLLKTHNPTGGFTTTPCDLVSQQFIEYASLFAGKNGKVLEIGAGFGAASLQALEKGVQVFCNDIDPGNLAVVENRFVKKNKKFCTEEDQLVLLPGQFPEELSGLPKNFFDAILICRVLHFFNGEKIEKSLKQLADCLKPSGKLFVVCETPYLNNWQNFLPEYEKRIHADMKWPGEINNPADYETSGRVSALPKFVHWITKEILMRSLQQSALQVEQLSYIDRRGQFPEDLLLDGRESIGAIATKPY